MSNDRQMTTAPTAGTEIQSLATRLKLSMPAWVQPRDLDAEQFFVPAVPLGQGAALREAAKAHREGMAPASHDDRLSALRALRLGTVARNESPEEARASFAKLLDDLRDVPADILRDACSVYVNEPGTRFFPRGAGELRTFTEPLMRQRGRRAVRLDDMANASDNVFDEGQRVTPEQIAEIKAEFGLSTNPYPEQPKPLGTTPRMPTRADYIAMGVDPSVLDALPGREAA